MNVYRSTILVIVFFNAAYLAAQGTFDEVYTIFQNKCATCHQPGNANGGLDLVGAGATLLARKQSVHAQLVGRNPQNAFAASRGDQRVTPGRMDRSFLFRKINDGLEPTIGLDPRDGEKMPANGSGHALTDTEKEMVRQWILYGAPLTGQVVSRKTIEDYYTMGGQEAFPSGSPPPPAAGEGFQIKMGPFFLEPGGEVEYFQKWALQLDEDVDVHRIDFQISNYSHHFLLYYFENDGSGVPAGLRLDQNHSDIGLFAAIQEKIDLDLPQGTAFRWKKDVVLDLNSHYINYSFTQVYKAEVYLNVYTDPSGTAAQEMESQLLPNPLIYIPNDGTPRTFQQPVFNNGGEIFVWGMMGHTHKYGTDYKAYRRNANGTKGEMIYDASCPEGIPGCVSPFFDYQHIPMRYFEPLLPLDINPGIIHEATYINDGPRPVRWGATSDDEMMILILMFTRDTAGVISSDTNFGREDHGSLSSWPNPVLDTWQVELPEVPGLWRLELFGIDGKRLSDIPLDHLTGTIAVDVSHLKPGMYLWRISESKGQMYTGKLIKAAH